MGHSEIKLEQTEVNNRRLARNTTYLYVRMFFTMIVSLYTSRIVLNTLGVVNFGIYNVIGGLVSMLSFVNATLASSSERFLSLHIGQNNQLQIRKTFSSVLIIHLIIAFLIVLVCEFFGLTFLKSKMNFPPDKIYATIIAFHFSVVSIFFSFILVPFMGLIIAYEKMNLFAYLSIIEVILKLVIIFLLKYINYDKLIVYSCLMSFVSIFVFAVYYISCKINFECVKLIKVNDRRLFKEILFFSGWNVFSSLSSTLSNQGINVLMNIFFGPIVNAARGIAFQVNSAIGAFTSNFQVAVNPQIFKLWGRNEKQEFKELILNSSKYSFLLISLILCPILLEINTLLSLWLINVPLGTAMFCRIIVIQIIVHSLSRSYITGMNAIGAVKKLNLYSGIVLLIVFPISYILYKYGFPAYMAFIVYGFSLFLEFIIAFVLLQKFIDLTINDFIVCVIGPITKVLVITLPIPILLHLYLDGGIIRLLLISIVSVGLFVVATYFFVIDSYLKQKIKDTLIRKKNNDEKK